MNLPMWRVLNQLDYSIELERYAVIHIDSHDVHEFLVEVANCVKPFLRMMFLLFFKFNQNISLILSPFFCLFFNQSKSLAVLHPIILRIQIRKEKKRPH